MYGVFVHKDFIIYKDIPIIRESNLQSNRYRDNLYIDSYLNFVMTLLRYDFIVSAVSLVPVTLVRI